MIRRPFSLLLAGLALALALAVAGCGEDRPVTFGAVLPLTGESLIYGVAIQNGIEVAYDRIRARSDYPYKVELVVRDSESDAGRARDLVDQLYGQGALAIIGGVTSKEALEMVDVADQYDRILLSPSASNPELTGISKNFYRVFPSDFIEGSKMGNFATQVLEINRVVILAAESLYGRGVQEVFKNEFERYGGEVLDVLEYPEGTIDFSGLMDRVMTLNPEAVYLSDFAGPIGNMVKTLRDRGYRGRILTPSAFAAPEVLETAGEAAEGVFLTQPVFEVESEEPHVKAFVDAYRAKFGESPGLYAAHGYDAMMVVAEALVEGGRPTSNDFWKGMRSIREFPGVTGLIRFNERGDVQKFPRVYIVQNGSLIDYDKFRAEKRLEIERRLEELRRRAREVRTEG